MLSFLLLSLPVGSSAEAGALGCGVAIAGDWPNCGRKFDTTYAYNLAGLMASAEHAVGRPVWRYDWRSTQHPVSGNWPYIATDWCPQGGMNEHPNPAGPFPGFMGWNEPNSNQQCNQPCNVVSEFVTLAKQFKANNKFVVSPAPTHDQANTWMDCFLNSISSSSDPAARFMDLDYLAYHHYVTCDARTTLNDLVGQMEQVFMSYKNVMDKYNAKGMHIQGLWLTEVACGWTDGRWTGNCGAQCTENTMTALLQLVQKHPELKTWSWFAYNNFGNLWVDDQAQGYPLTALGQQYFRSCNPTVANKSIIV